VEKQAALIWQQLAGRELVSSKDGSVTVIYPGRCNGDYGPDFRDAVIVYNSLLKGDVEVHIKSSDWYGHQHHADARYNSVILHVVLWQDDESAVMLQNGKTIPVLCLAQALRHQAYLLPYRLPCYQILDSMNIQTLGKLLNSAGETRFTQKATRFQYEMAESEAAQVLFRGIMRALGYARNTQPFEALAHRLPLNYLEAHNSLAVKQALLLGTAGLLPSQRRQGQSSTEKETRELEAIWQQAGKSTETMKESDWNLSHIYANNSPVRRIIALSYLLERYQPKLLDSVLQLVRDTCFSDGHRVLEKGLAVAGDGYWRDHFDFDEESRIKGGALLGRNKAGEIVVNVILPFAFAWAKIARDTQLATKARKLYHSYPKLAQNEITLHMANQLCLDQFAGFTACHQQGLIHIFRNYCREGKCSDCLLVHQAGVV